MKLKRLALVFAFVVVIGSCLAPMTSHANLATAERSAVAGSCAQSVDLTMDRPDPGARCIPCSPNHPCANPLTVCSYSGSSTHGCCLGYAGGN